MMKIKPLLLSAGLFVAALSVCAKPHDHGNVGAKGIHGLHGSFADGVLGDDDRRHGASLFDLDFASNSEADARDLDVRDLHAASNGAHELNSVSSYATAPVPEPETYVLMLAGLGAVGLLSLRRKINR
jgi:hypothetical protein